MAGHSHSANIKFRKDRVDQVRGKTFSKLVKMITVAAKMGGGDPDANPRLRLAIEKARAASMPKDNITRAIKKGTGESGGSSFEELLYEGYAAGGAALMIDILTDNRNRTAPETRKIFEKAGANLGSTGSVAYMFQRKAIFSVNPDEEPGEDKLTELVLESGAEDLVDANGVYQIVADPGEFMAVKEKLEAASLSLKGAEIGYIPETWVEISELAAGRKILKLVDGLEDHEDVQAVYGNYRFSEAVLEELAKG